MSALTQPEKRTLTPRKIKIFVVRAQLLAATFHECIRTMLGCCVCFREGSGDVGGEDESEVVVVVGW